jgi:mannose-6-phosphate isomerase-like protein (cupin superfamily)
MPELKAVVEVKDGIEFRGLGALVKRLIYPETTGAMGATLAVVYINPGEEIVLHHHPEEELYYIISGTGTVTLDDKTVPIGPGSSVYIGPNVVHGQRPTGNEPLYMVAVVTPPFKPGQGPTLD